MLHHKGYVKNTAEHELAANVLRSSVEGFQPFGPASILLACANMPASGQHRQTGRISIQKRRIRWSSCKRPTGLQDSKAQVGGWAHPPRRPRPRRTRRPPPRSPSPAPPGPAIIIQMIQQTACWCTRCGDVAGSPGSMLIVQMMLLQACSAVWRCGQRAEGAGGAPHGPR